MGLGKISSSFDDRCFHWSKYTVRNTIIESSGKSISHLIAVFFNKKDSTDYRVVIIFKEYMSVLNVQFRARYKSQNNGRASRDKLSSVTLSCVTHDFSVKLKFSP